MAFYEVTRDTNYSNVETFLTMGTNAHFHNTIEILAVESGSIKLNLNGKSSILETGNIVFFNSFDIHGYDLMDKYSKGLVWVIPRVHLESSFGKMSNTRFENQIFNDKECLEELVYLYNLSSKYYSNEKKNINLINSLGQSVFAIVASHLVPIKDTQETNIMKDVLFYLYENFTNELTLKNISSKFGYTPNHFSYIFNNYMQTSLSAFINNLRTEYSLGLLKKGMSVIDAAENSGFSSLRTFYRYFNQKYKKTPLQYLNKTANSSLKNEVVMSADL